MRNSSGTILGDLLYRPERIGGGGFIGAGDIADDGTLVYRADTYNGWILKAGESEAVPMLRPGVNTDPSLITYTTGQPFTSLTGTYDVAICATNSSIAYFCTQGYVYKTVDGFATVTRTNYPRDLNLNPNNTRQLCKPLAVDPQNGDVVIFATGSGVHISSDGGATWTDVPTATIPAPSTRSSVHFDRTSAVTGGKTQGIYIGVNGSGVYHSTDGGATWSLLASSPTSFKQMHCHPTSGELFFIGTSTAGNGQFVKFTPPSTWIAPTGINDGSALAVNSGDPTKVFIFRSTNSGMKVSTDGGNTFGAWKTGSRVATDIPWLAWTNELFMSVGQTIFHPTLNRIIFFEGIGVWKCDNPPTDTTPHVWTAMCKGLENLVGQHVAVDPNGRVHFAVHDRAFFMREKDERDVFPLQHGPTNNAFGLSHGGQIDWAIDNYDYVVGCCTQPSSYKVQISTDGGRTWANTAQTMTLGFGGNIAVSNAGNFVYLPAQGGYPVYSKDGGATINPCDVAANLAKAAEAFNAGDAVYWTGTQCTNTASGTTLIGVAAVAALVGDATVRVRFWVGWINSYTYKRGVLKADKLNPGYFYLFNVGTGTNDAADQAMRGVWLTTDGGDTWARVRTTVITTFGADFWNSNLKQVPGQAGHWFWSAGDGGDGLYKSTDNCVTFTKIAGSAETFHFGFGKALPGGSGYPTILKAAYRGGVYGFYVSYDAGASWALQTSYPGGMVDSPADIEGDMSADGFGRFYIAWSGASLGRLDYGYQMRLRAA